MSQSSVLPSTRPKPRREKVHLRVIKGGFVPADKYAENLLRKKKLKIDDLVKVDIVKLRNTKFNRKVHKLGLLCAQNIEAFHGMDGHKVIKKIQLEANIYCEEIALTLFGFESSVWRYVRPVVDPILNMIGFRITDNGMLIARYPLSISFDSMDQEQFEGAAKQISRFIAERYWPDLDAKQIESMADCMVEE